MAATIHVKSKGKWKPVKLDPKLYTDKHFGGLICVEELRDYEIVKTLADGKGTLQNDISSKQKLKQKQSDRSVKKKSSSKRKSAVDPDSSDVKAEKIPKVERGKTKIDISTASEQDQSDVKISRKKKKLLKWKLKARLRKEAQKAKVVLGQSAVSVDLADDQTEDVEKSDKPSGDKKKNVKDQKKNRKTKKGKSGAVKTSTVNKADPVKASEYQEKKTTDRVDMSAWLGLHVPEPVLEALADQRFTSPMPIQTLVLPSAIRDHMDIVGAAQTGSGKTLAFAIPVLHNILKYKERRNGLEDSVTEASSQHNEVGRDAGEDDVAASDDVTDEESDDVTDEESDDVIDSENDDIMDEEEMSEGEFDNPPDEEEIEDFEGDGTGLVKVMNNMEFDWAEETANGKKVKPHSGALFCLVLTPTRELAVQVKNHIEAVAKYTDIKVGLIVGGMAPQKQRRLLKRCPEIVVATPGRLWELIEEGDSYLSGVEDVRCLVIDEADRMVEKGHFEELSILLERINANEAKRKRRQTFVFSATLTVVHSAPNRFLSKKKKRNLTSDVKLEKLMAKVGMDERPKVIDLSGRVGTADTLTEAKIHCATQEKDGYLYYLSRQYPGRTLVFSNSKDCVRRLSSVFTLLQRNPLTLHADMHQKQRLKNLEKFTGDDGGLLLATDVAARGLDIPNVQHVIHYQVPRTTENYVHRSGRTARAYKEGLSVMLIGPEDLKNYRKIIYTLNKNEDLPMFPMDYQCYNELRDRVGLARQIDSQEHRFIKLKHQNDWFQRAALEVDVELDEEIVLNDLGDRSEQADLKVRLKQMKDELSSLMKRPVSSYNFSGKYPTRTGKLLLPKQPDVGEDAISCVKKDRAFQSKVLRKPTRSRQRPFTKKKKKK